MENQDKKTAAKLSLRKDKIANLSAKQMESIYAGVEAESKEKGSTKHDFTCTWCANTVPCAVTIIL
ncbi:class I lanthipeptide [Pedobacter gandavensis]|uniref:class I lanthipeptide n=1 Tax=Pedobacter gandavensis TaxID=2679963 RepID=UPI00292DC727|nr:class I lanthipeptide [Pedobacter gandavensis]